jgi:ribosome-associated translation inhibitor RaiA
MGGLVDSHDRAGDGTPIEVVVRGPIGRRVRRELRQALARVAATAPRPVVFVRGSLRRDADPAVEQPVHADAAVAYRRSIARAHATARTPIGAIDLLVRHLHREITEQRRREASARRRHGARSEPRTLDD